MADITTLYAGDNWELAPIVTGIAPTKSITKLSITIKELGNEAAPDTEALIQVTVTAVASASGQITDTGATDGTARAVVYVPKESTATLDPLTPYAYDVWVLFTDGTQRTATSARIVPRQGVRTATT